MKRAVLRCRAMFPPPLAGEGRVGAAIAELDAVHLETDDHAWLADIRTLARAEMYHRFDMTDREHEALAEFWPRQPLLFEPNHAFTFGLIDYQETLKPRYQADRLLRTA